MKLHASLEPRAHVRLIVGREKAIAGLGIVFITTIVALREFSPEAHLIALTVLDLLTRTVALLFAVIDGHAEAYRHILPYLELEELRAIYAGNRVIALTVVVLALRRIYVDRADFEWNLWNQLQPQLRTIFWTGMMLTCLIPVAFYGLFFGYAEQNFFEFETGINLVGHDVYYYLDYFLFLVISWQFFFLIPTITYFAGKIVYGYRIASFLRPRKAEPPAEG